MKLIVDAYGGDNAPHEIIKGCILAAKELDVDIILVGDELKTKAELKSQNAENAKGIFIEHAVEVIQNHDDPTSAVKAKKDSSIVVGINLLKEGRGDAFISAGNTGAIVTASSIILRRIKGVKRAALAPVVPTQKGCALLVDAGANTDCKPEYFMQFGVMGSIYMQKIMGIDDPKVGLVNIGSEEGKGPENINAAYAMLKDAHINFKGNIEARLIPSGEVDVIVCDGFVGNVILKLYEGLGLTFYSYIKDIFTKNIIANISALLVKKSLRQFKEKVDYTEYGGAILLGIDGLVIKAHGSSNAKAIFSTLKQAKKSVETGMLDEIRSHIINLGDDVFESKDI